MKKKVSQLIMFQFPLSCHNSVNCLKYLNNQFLRQENRVEDFFLCKSLQNNISLTIQLTLVTSKYASTIVLGNCSLISLLFNTLWKFF